MSEPVLADLSGKTCLVTGASAGIGLATARELARLGARVVMAVRDPEKGERARRSVMGATGRDVELAVVDLARQDSIRTFARDFARRHPRLDVLVNNAGIWTETRRVSPDGIELTWATNVLGYFLVTELLLPPLQAAGKAPRGQRRLAARRRPRPRRRAVREAAVERPRGLRAEQAGGPHADLGPRPAARRHRGHAPTRAPRLRGHRDLRQGRRPRQPSPPRSTRSCGRSGPRRAPTPSSGSRRARTSRAAAASSGSTGRSAAAASATRRPRRRCGRSAGHDPGPRETRADLSPGQPPGKPRESPLEGPSGRPRKPPGRPS